MENLGSLSSLHDIIIPAPVSFWPLALGWYALGVLLLVYLFHFSLKLWNHYRANAYRY
jgi:hypothetical protein